MPEELSQDEQKRLDTGLLQATRDGNLAGVRMCLEEGADVNAWEKNPSISGNINNNTALTLAVHSGREDIARELIVAGADVNVVGPGNNHVLCVGYGNGQTWLRMTKLLLAAGASPTWPVGLHPNQVTPVSFASRCVVSPLYDDQGAESAQAVRDMSALLEEVRNDGRIRRRLLQEVGLSNEDMERREDALIAIENQVEAQRARNADEKRNANLADAAQDGIVESIVRRLNDGANVNGCDKNGISALGRAISSGQMDAARALLEAGADPDAVDKSGYRPLEYIHRNQNESTILPRVKLLLAAGADPKSWSEDVLRLYPADIRGYIQSVINNPARLPTAGEMNLDLGKCRRNRENIEYRQYETVDPNNAESLGHFTNALQERGGGGSMSRGGNANSTDGDF